jgi:hypothetical protein
MTTTTFSIWDSEDQTANTPVTSVQVRLYSSDGTSFVTYGVTDSSGNYVVDVPDATYWVRFFKPGYAFPSKLSAAVDASAASNVFDVEAENLEILPPSSASNLCRVSGYVVGAGGQPRQGATIQFMLADLKHIVNDRPITASKVSTRSDKYGYVEVELIQGAFYEVVVEGLDDQVFVSQVPKTAAAALVDVIWPYPARVSLSTTTVSMAVEEVEVSAVLVLSSGVEMPLPVDAPLGAVSFLLQPKSSDENVATVSLTETTLTITGIAAGTCTVSFTATGSYAQRFPALSISFAEINVTVT